MAKKGQKKVLILTYYWPPSGGAGVQRWLKFSKYLRDFNYEPVIYTAENPEYAAIDVSLYRDIPDQVEVLKTRVWEPYSLYKVFTFQRRGHKVNTAFLNEKKKQGIAEKIAVWIRGNLFIPDARRYWINPSVKFLTSYLKENPVELIVSTGTPHSLHLVGMKLSKDLNIKWIADFRDPWTRIYYQSSLMVGKRARRKHLELERQVVKNASAVTVVTNDMKTYFEEIRGNLVHLIPNGYDHEDFEELRKDKGPVGLDDKFTLTHIGTLFPLRNPVALWKILASLVRENKNFAEDLEVNLIGALDFSVSQSLGEAGLENWVSRSGNIPYREAIERMSRSQVLLLLIMNRPESKGILTGKLFEYMNAGRPILAIGSPDGEVGRVLNETKTGYIADFEDTERIKSLILNLYQRFKAGKLYINPLNIERYSRKNLTAAMAAVLNELTD